MIFQLSYQLVVVVAGVVVVVDGVVLVVGFLVVGSFVVVVVGFLVVVTTRSLFSNLLNKSASSDVHSGILVGSGCRQKSSRSFGSTPRYSYSSWENPMFSASSRRLSSRARWMDSMMSLGSIVNCRSSSFNVAGISAVFQVYISAWKIL